VGPPPRRIRVPQELVDARRLQLIEDEEITLCVLSMVAADILH
jgi:hypothetical protein